MPLTGIGAAELRELLLAGSISVGEVVSGFLAAVGEDPLRAWAAIDPDGLVRQADALDAVAPELRQRMPLYGIPVAVKDNFDTADLPTAYGSPIYAGHRPADDAAAVRALREAGALIAGKTKLAELAWLTPSDTLNPVDPARTPGGSSSGSAAAVAAGLVPLATGSQTAGSINRPASYCGVLGWKPTFGRYSRAGVKLMSVTLDTVGLLTREIADLRLADGVFAVSGGGAGPAWVGALAPRLAFARTARWDAVEDEAAQAIEAWLQSVREAGVVIDSVELPGYARLAEAQELIQRVEAVPALAAELRDHAAELSAPLRAMLVDGAAIPDVRAAAARALVSELAPALVAALRPFDAVLTPSATGVAPLGLKSTGDSLFCRVWTLIGAPSLSVPLVRGACDLPVGLQLVGAPGADADVLAAADWLLGRFGPG